MSEELIAVCADNQREPEAALFVESKLNGAAIGLDFHNGILYLDMYSGVSVDGGASYAMAFDENNLDDLQKMATMLSRAWYAIKLEQVRRG